MNAFVTTQDLTRFPRGIAILLLVHEWILAKEELRVIRDDVVECIPGITHTAALILVITTRTVNDLLHRQILEITVSFLVEGFHG